MRDLSTAPNPGKRAIGVAMVIGVTALVGIIAWGLLAILEQTTHERARTIWTVVALVIFLLSMLGPITSAVNVFSGIVLASMHLGAAATIIQLMRKSRV